MYSCGPGVLGLHSRLTELGAHAYGGLHGCAVCEREEETLTLLFWKWYKSKLTNVAGAANLKEKSHTQQ